MVIKSCDTNLSIIQLKMYLDYFSLKKFPFRITPDPTLFFPGGADGRGVVLDALIYAITSGEGILKVVGEVGSGKTMLCRMLGGKLSDSVEIVYLANPNLSARDIIFAIAFELELDVDSNTDRLLAMHKLQDYLLKKHSSGGTVVVFIEEAQSMPLEALEEIRLLSNLETHQHKLMQIVLFGQPELDKKLQKKSIRQLRERITHSFNLEPLKLEATREYLRFRLSAAGCPWPQLFSPQAEKLLAKTATGLTRRINILADKSLMSAYADSSTRQEPRNSAGEIQSMVLPRHVRAAIKDCGYNNLSSSLFRYTGIGLAAVLSVALLVYGVSSLDLFSASSNPTSNPTRNVNLVSNEPEEVQIIVQAAEPAQVEFSVNEDVLPVEEVVEVIPLVAEEIAAAEINDVIEMDVQALVQQESALLVEELPEPESVDVTVVNISAEAEIVVNELVEEPVEELALLADEQEVVDVQQSPAISNSEMVSPEIIDTSDMSLVALRGRATKNWLQSLSRESVYTLQLISISFDNRSSLEEFLQFFSVTGLLEKTYVCAISATSNSPEQWLVLHEEFSGVTAARNYMDELPEHLKRFSPYIRNTSDVACKE